MTASGLLFSVSLTVGLAVGAGVVVGLAAGALVAGAVWTRCRRRHDALEASEARQRRLLDHAADIVLVHALDGADLWLNRAGQAALGVAGTPALSLVDTVAVEDRATVRAHLAALAETGRARSDVRVGGPSGERVLLDLASQVVEVESERRVVSVGRDVGAERAEQAALAEARDQAQEGARVRSQFLASMSHEIRTPLTSVVGFAEILRDEVAEPQRGLVDAIAAGGERLLATLDSVLDLATLDARRETLRPEALDVVAEVEAALDRARPAADARGIALDVSSVGPELRARLDADALGRVLAHVVGNAVRFTEAGGVTVEVDADAHAVSLRVIDTGIGIPEAALPTLFDGFESPGQGFGLAISQQLVHLMGGTIAVESRWRAGTAVTVVLPRGEAGPVEAEVAEAVA
ncbi:ATP-binding protein [Rubrivirga sp.]|uniref:PAS domain-containing sensor histidine kinase n=1 Tax=Rubrivirga sp. TaxID=1885344 RepID=UPI003B51CD61